MPNAAENMPLPDAAEPCTAEPCSAAEDKPLDPVDAAEDKPLDAFDAAEAGIMSSSSDEDEADHAPKKRKRELEKALLLQDAMRQVSAAANDPAALAGIARLLAHWQRTAKKATRELYRIKRSCSCGRAVNYPWTLR
jgi:hypothetical protein